MDQLTVATTVQSKIQMLTDLTDVCFARKVIMAATLNPKNISPIDYCYGALNIKLECLNKESGEYKVLEQYATNTSGYSGRKIKRIYRLQRKGEAERMEKWKQLDNHYLLWHGSGIANFLGILSQGLRIAPPNAPVSGYAFGKGIYFADMFAKSFPYCRASGSERCYMLLCEVALGRMHSVHQATYIEQLPEGFNSCIAHGSQGPDFAQSVVLSNGVRIPIQGAVHYPHDPLHPRYLPHNEYIVYQTSQVRLRYLVELK